MEPENHPIEKENHLNQTSILGFHVSFREINIMLFGAEGGGIQQMWNDSTPSMNKATVSSVSSTDPQGNNHLHTCMVVLG